MQNAEKTKFSIADLERRGFVQLPDGSWSHPSNLPDRTPRLPDAIPQHPAGKTLVPPSRRKTKGKGRFAIRIERHASRLLDADNFAGGCKPLIDQLRYYGLIADDDPASIELTYCQIRSKQSGFSGTVVIIKPLTKPESLF